MKRILFFLLALMLVLVSTSALAQIPREINYQGLLLGADEAPVPEGNYKITFKLYDESNNLLWTEVHNQVFVAGGLFHVFLGSVNPLNLDFDKAYFLGIQVGSDPELQPRMFLAPVPYSFRAEDANAVGGFHVSDIPAPNTLLPLDNNAKFPASVLPGGGTAGDFLKKNEPDTSRATTSSPLLLISNLGSGDGINGRNIGGNGRGVVGRSDNNDGVVGWTGANEKSGVFGHTNVSGAYGVSGNNSVSGSQGYLGGAYGVFGKSMGGHHAGYFEASGGLNAAVYGSTTGPNSYGGFFKASANYSYGIYAEGPPPGNNGCAALFKGNVEVRSLTTDAIVLELGEGLDYAEGFNVSAKPKSAPGSVLIIDPANPGKLAVSEKPYDRKVAGIVAGAKGMGSGVRLGSDQFDYDVALAGRVYCNVDATYGEVSPGDLLTTSPTPGYAMVVSDYARAQGAILGKAMEKLSQGQKGQILVLVTLQ